MGADFLTRNHWGGRQSWGFQRHIRLLLGDRELEKSIQKAIISESGGRAGATIGQEGQQLGSRVGREDAEWERRA